LILDGRNIKVDDTEWVFVGPTIFDEVDPNMSIAKEEIFGPVVSIVRGGQSGGGLTLLENSEYGNATCFTPQTGRRPGIPNTAPSPA